jgi:hypothetical protein
MRLGEGPHGLRPSRTSSPALRPDPGVWTAWPRSSPRPSTRPAAPRTPSTLLGTLLAAIGAVGIHPQHVLKSGEEGEGRRQGGCGWASRGVSTKIAKAPLRGEAVHGHVRNAAHHHPAAFFPGAAVVRVQILGVLVARRSSSKTSSRMAIPQCSSLLSHAALVLVVVISLGMPWSPTQPAAESSG